MKECIPKDEMAPKRSKGCRKNGSIYICLRGISAINNKLLMASFVLLVAIVNKPKTKGSRAKTEIIKSIKMNNKNKLPIG